MPRLFSCADRGAEASIVLTPSHSVVLVEQAARLFPIREAGGRRAACPTKRSQLRLGFTFVESVIAMSVIALAGAALLTSVAGAVTSCNDAIFQSVGRGLAQQLMDEIAARKVPNATTTAAATRSLFTTVDDYSGFTESPPHTKGGDVLGTEQSSAALSYSAMMMSGTSTTSRPAALQVATDFMQRFTRSVLVERVQPGTGGAWTVTAQSTLYRRVTVTVTYTVTANQTRQVAKVSRVFAAVSASP